MQIRNLGGWGAQMASPNPLDSRFRGNDGVEKREWRAKIGGNGAIIVRFSLMSTRPRKTKFETYPCKPIKGEGIRWLQFILDFGWLSMAATVWIPAFAGMTVKIGGDGAIIVRFSLMSTRPSH